MSRALESLLLLVGLLALSGTSLAHAYTIDLGGTGEDGAINVTADTTLPLPESGVIHATTVNVAAGATLTFTPNSRNTGVTIVATGPIVIDGTISVDGLPGVVGAPGAGGPGGGPGGPPRLWRDGDSYQSTRYFVDSTCSEGNRSCFPIVGARGGNGSYYNVSSPTEGCTLGGGGGGGAGALWLTSHVSISGNGLLTAVGGVADLTRPTGGTCTNPNSAPRATDGADGSIFLSAPLLDWDNLTFTARNVRTSALQTNGTPTSSAVNSFQSDSDLMAWRNDPPPVQARITAVDGQPVPATGPLAVTTTATTATVDIEATGCDGRLQVTVRGVRALWLSWSTSRSVTFNNAVLNQTYTDELILSSLSAGNTYFLTIEATCS